MESFSEQLSINATTFTAVWADKWDATFTKVDGTWTASVRREGWAIESTFINASTEEDFNVDAAEMIEVLEALS